MQSEQSDSEDFIGKGSSSNDFNLDMNATHLITSKPRNKQTALVEKLDIKPGEQRRVTLGSFTNNNPAKGFSIEFKPDTVPDDSVVSQISALGTSKQYKLVMHIANYWTKTVRAEVRQL